MDKSFNIGVNLSYQNQNNVDEESDKRLNNFYEKDVKNFTQKKAYIQAIDKTVINNIIRVKSSLLLNQEQKKAKFNTSINKSRSNSKDNICRSRSRSKDQFNQREKRAQTPIKQERLLNPFKEGKKGKMNRITSYNNLTLVEKNNNENILWPDALLELEKSEEQLKHDEIDNLEEMISNTPNFELLQEPKSEHLAMILTDQDQDIPDDNATNAYTVIKLVNIN